MSSSSPPRPDRLAAVLAVALALAMILIIGPGAGPPPAAAIVPLPVVAVIVGAQQSSVVVDLGVGMTAPDSVSATLAGAPQQATVTPVLSDQLAVALVVDGSQAGGPALPTWLSAAARLVLELPAAARAVVIADTTPPSVIAGPQAGAIGVVGALSTIRAAGRRSTSDALTLAIDQVRTAPADSRLVVLYTTSRNAGGEQAPALTARLIAAGAILVVIGQAVDNAYWSDVSRPTGGFFVSADLPVVVPALDRVSETLRGRYRVTFATPRKLPARVSVRVNAGEQTLTTDVVVPASKSPSRPAPGVGTVVWAIVAVALLAFAVAVLVRRRTAGRVAATSPPLVARGRASVPGALPPPSPPARGHAEQQ
jgi:hypothetical protein